MGRKEEKKDERRNRGVARGKESKRVVGKIKRGKIRGRQGGRGE